MGEAPSTKNWKALQQKYVDQIIQRARSSDPRIRQALVRYPRHFFAPKSADLNEIYSDNVVQVLQKDHEVVSTMSQPSLVVAMTELLKIKKGEKILEIGTSSGYSTALLSAVNEFPDRVYTVEYQADLEAFARDHFKKCGLEQIHTRIGDGFFGWSEYAPYDVITGSVAFPALPRPLVEQLADGGRIALPLALDEEGLAPYFIAKKTGLKLEGRFWGSPLFFVPLKGEQNLEAPFLQVAPADVMQAMKGSETKITTHELKWDELGGLFLYIALKKNKLMGLPAGRSLRGWVLDSQNFMLFDLKNLYFRGSSEFIARAKGLLNEWMEYGKPHLDDYVLEIDLTRNIKFDGWRVWDCQIQSFLKL